MEWNVTKLVESRDLKTSLRDKVGLGLVISLRAVREQVITHRNMCSLSSLKERGTLNISRARVLL